MALDTYMRPQYRGPVIERQLSDPVYAQVVDAAVTWATTQPDPENVLLACSWLSGVLMGATDALAQARTEAVLKLVSAGYSNGELAEVSGLSRQRISQLRNRK